jgi:hypothetical protein
MGRLRSRTVRGALAGAVGTVALDATTHLDMVLRGRPPSSTPQQTVEATTSRLHVPLPEDDRAREAVLDGIAPLLGMAAGVAAGVVLGLLRPPGARGGVAATTATAWVLGMLVGNGPMTLVGVTDPRTWSTSDWAADVVPHLAYAAGAAGALRALEPRC